jgi:HEAT repeat protein
MEIVWGVRGRKLAIGLFLRVSLVVLLSTSLGAAAERLVELATKLKTDKDFRVRTQAALALGVSQSERAVPPLCAGLQDENHTVRAASTTGGSAAAGTR